MSRFFPSAFALSTPRSEESSEDREHAADDSPHQQVGAFDHPACDQTGEENKLDGKPQERPDQSMKGPP